MDQRPILLTLPSGREIFLRPLHADDTPRARDAISNMSDRSRAMRFFDRAAETPDMIANDLVSVDGDQHIAWGAFDAAHIDMPLLGAAHAIRKPQSHTADLAIAVLDDFHGQRLARLLTGAVASDCLARAVYVLNADVLPENDKANALFNSLGGAQRQSGTQTGYRLETGALLKTLATVQASPAMQDMFSALARYSGGRVEISPSAARNSLAPLSNPAFLPNA